MTESHDYEIEAIFNYRYLDYLTMEEIAKEMHYDERTIRRKHNNSIEKLSGNVR
ncbi:MAG: sigma factor-like helix-turn-helix DNA-binding protein [Porcipelethomonas sp.]